MTTTVSSGAALPFDELAEGYDREFSHTPLGALLRRAVRRRLRASFSPGAHVLELGCGTGEDAVYLARRGLRVTATDSSERMLALAERKARGAGLADSIQFAPLDLGKLASEPPEGARPAGLYDGAFSNFGAVNCVERPRLLARGLAARLRSGAPLVLCVMGPVVPWEWLWFGLRGRVGKAFRRLTPGGVDWRGIRIRYPSIGRLRRAFSEDFEPRRVSALGVFLPPTYAGGWIARRPRLAVWLSRTERRLETLPPLPWLADHYLLELERR